MANDKSPVVWTFDGTQGGDNDYYTLIPTEEVAGLGVCKDPESGSFIDLTAFATGLGYLVGTDPVGTKRRIIMTDHPDGG